ncbi:MAG: hypothetical protein F6J93_09475 [Oscillatoria sp. SIO1A7]|nr:hypothetical protein [Oscillatoria sp. SIO1A7]
MTDRPLYYSLLLPVRLSDSRKRTGNSIKFPYTLHPTPYTLVLPPSSLFRLT